MLNIFSFHFFSLFVTHTTLDYTPMYTHVFIYLYIILYSIFKSLVTYDMQKYANMHGMHNT